MTPISPISSRKRAGFRDLIHDENGQALSVWLAATMVMVSVFMGIAYDLSVAWMHKQNAQIAAQSACEAGAIDMAYAATNGITTIPGSSYNFLPTDGTTPAGNCASASASPMCYYAALNGYDPSQNSAAGVTWAMSTTPPLNSSNTAGFSRTSNNVPGYMSVTVTENVPVVFMGLFAKMFKESASWTTIKVAGQCNCGIDGNTTTNTVTQAVGSTGQLSATCNLSGTGSCTNKSAPAYLPEQAINPNSTVTVTATYTGGLNGPDTAGGSGVGYITCDGGKTWTAIGNLTFYESNQEGTGTALCNAATDANQIGAYAWVTIGGSPNNESTDFFDMSISVTGVSQVQTSTYQATTY